MEFYHIGCRFHLFRHMTQIKAWCILYNDEFGLKPTHKQKHTDQEFSFFFLEFYLWTFNGAVTTKTWIIICIKTKKKKTHEEYFSMNGMRLFVFFVGTNSCLCEQINSLFDVHKLWEEKKTERSRQQKLCSCNVSTKQLKPEKIQKDLFFFCFFSHFLCSVNKMKKYDDDLDFGTVKVHCWLFKCPLLHIIKIPSIKFSK